MKLLKYLILHFLTNKGNISIIKQFKNNLTIFELKFIFLNINYIFYKLINTVKIFSLYNALYCTCTGKFCI
jgi:hypothetical protein